MARALAKILLVAGLLAALAAGTARADYRDLIIDACRSDERVDGTYSQKDYREALANLSDDQLQYTDCEAILRSAQRAAARAQAGNGGAGATEIDKLIAGAGGDPLAGATPQERAAVEQAAEQAQRTGGGPVTVGGEVVEPSSLGAGRVVAASASDLPAPLLGALVLALIGVIAVAAHELAPRIRARRG
jgi:hypothetical protein